MHNFNLKVSDRVEVIVAEKAYKALIMDVENDFIIINLPVNNGQYLMLHSGEEIELNSYTYEGGCFNFYSKVISKGKEDNILHYKIEKPFNIRKIQRRNFFRVDLVNALEYKIITNVSKEDFDNIPYKKGLMVDLSGGGLKLKTKDSINKDDLILVNIRIKEIPIELKCNIVRIENTADNEKLCGLRFMDITQAQSDNIIQELFEIMRKKRARE